MPFAEGTSVTFPIGNRESNVGVIKGYEKNGKYQVEVEEANVKEFKIQMSNKFGVDFGNILEHKITVPSGSTRTRVLVPGPADDELPPPRGVRWEFSEKQSECQEELNNAIIPPSTTRRRAENRASESHEIPNST
ncbi:hypothetical protein ZTR_06472 [Talaromyces verruculosus]|nr:hypothetical protein ZTR_06472 [Talaromyces verruculosus]